MDGKECPCVSKDCPLVPGLSPHDLITYTHASLGTGPKGRSVIANLTKLQEGAGAVSAYTKQPTSCSHQALKHSRTVNILKELHMVLNDVFHLWSDNLAMVRFVRGEGVANGVRHIELRMWFVRERGIKMVLLLL